MERQYKIAIVGNRDAIMPFKMVGIDTYPVTTASQAKETITDLADQKYGIIYLTEDFAEEIYETIEYYDSQVIPSIILIPTHKGSLGIGMKRVSHNVEKAVGQDIL